MPRTLFYTHHHTIPLPPGHKFPIDKYRLLYELLNAEKRFLLEPAPLADQATVELVHDREYVSAFMRGTLDAAASGGSAFPGRNSWSHEQWPRWGEHLRLHARRWLQVGAGILPAVRITRFAATAQDFV